MVEHIEVLVEEPSMEAALRLLLPKIIGSLSFAIYPHQCKEDLLSKLPQRLRGYATWIPQTWRILVLVDRDDDNCHNLKARLEAVAANAGLRTRSTARGRPYDLINRLVIEELEAWYFGDWEAVRAAYPRVSENIPLQAKCRDPDAISGGTWETFERVVQQAGYFKTGLAKIAAAKSIVHHMVPDRNKSESFRKFHNALSELVSM